MIKEYITARTTVTDFSSLFSMPKLGQNYYCTVALQETPWQF
jgi:hypothetical protein